MKKLFFIKTFIFVFGLTFPTFSFAQGMPAPYRSEASGAGMGNNMMGGSDTITQSDAGLPADLSSVALAKGEASAQAGHTAREEAEGKEIWGKLQAEELKCEDLADDDFGALGEYFMGQMAGEQHEAMNNMMIQMMGEEGEKQMHVAMGKRMSGCEPNAPMPQNMPALSGVEGMGSGMMPMMMNMMMGGGIVGGSDSMMENFATNPTGWFGWGFSWIFMILWWVLIIAGIVALIKWFTNQSRGTRGHEKSPLEILKERYARGEIDKKEFEDKKKDLV